MRTMQESMIMSSAGERIHREATTWPGVTTGEHRFGGVEYRLGSRELGHLHGDKLLDIPFPLDVRNRLVSEGRAKVHHVLPESGWVSVYMRAEADVDNAIDLLRLSHDLAIQRHK
jgi:hypothetical protein